MAGGIIASVTVNESAGVVSQKTTQTPVTDPDTAPGTPVNGSA
jgi:hypothetical protein